MVAPHMGVWIETFLCLIYSEGSASLPTWERGLKYPSSEVCRGDNMSLPTWGRGLKLGKLLWCQGGQTVAPHVGAWIETWRLTTILC